MAAAEPPPSAAPHLSLLAVPRLCQPPGQTDRQTDRHQCPLGDFGPLSQVPCKSFTFLSHSAGGSRGPKEECKNVPQILHHLGCVCFLYLFVFSYLFIYLKFFWLLKISNLFPVLQKPAVCIYIAANLSDTAFCAILGLHGSFLLDLPPPCTADSTPASPSILRSRLL